ncbi:MAG: aminoacyl-tRNA hydrolase [Candidatus Dojkabacteria bacterium]|nr:aminoacyl-tRNA hydrolase [Candidatus Dojkabacteria bacterium]
MMLITGIGNPDTKYHNTRHNAGYFGIDAIRQELVFEGFYNDDGFKYDKNLMSETTPVKWASRDVIILQKTKTAMNNSGEAVKRVFDKYDVDINEFILFHDDLDIKLGEFKIQKGTSPKGHNGVKSIEDALGKKDFWRVRIGIDNRKEGDRVPGEDYVLQRFNKEEIKIIQGVCMAASEELLFTELFENWI